VFSEVDWSARHGRQGRRRGLIAFDDANQVNDERRAKASLDRRLHGDGMCGRAAGHQARPLVTRHTAMVVLV
jgi:hypothetical protein